MAVSGYITPFTGTPASLSLHIHHGAHLASLTQSLAAVLAEPLPDPFTPEVVAVPTAGARDWLQQQLAFRLGAGEHRDGITANVDMVFPRQFVAAALGHRLDAANPWDIERLTWTVLHVVDRGDVDVPGWSPRRRSDPAPAVGREYVRARRIADLFDRYANIRPRLLQQWQAGHWGDGTEDDHGAVVPLPAHQRWQAELWRCVRAEIGVPTAAELLPGLLDDLASGATLPALPQRAAVFGVSTISATLLGVLTALAEVRELHVYLLHPSPVAWERCGHRLAGRAVARTTTDVTAAVRHPLLRSWGRPPMETAALVAGVEATFTGHDDPSVAKPGSLLAQVQTEIATDSVPDREARAGLADRSIQVHTCPGTTRQLEVLRDALSHLFAADTSLAPHDVVILCPDLGRFAPQIESVFRRSSFPVPVRVSDRSLGSSTPVAAALSTLLSMMSGRFTGADMFGLVGLHPVRRLFGFDDDDVARINRWVGELATTWGLDGEHRSQWVPADILDGTWTSSLDRLLLGAAMPSPTPRLGSGDIVPFDDVDAQGLVTAGRVSELVARLRVARRRCSDRHTIGEWAVVIRELTESFFATGPGDGWQIAEIVTAVSTVADDAVVVASAAAEGGRRACTVGLSLTDARAALASALADRRGRLSLRTGAVTATAMIPLRNIPARVVCVLGLDDARLRSTTIVGDDILGARPCVGERDPRAEGRHLLLDALMSAGDHFIVTCDGRDITTNRPVPLPVHLHELLDAVSAGGANSPVVIRHPRQAYDERNLVAVTRNGASGGERAGRAGVPAEFVAGSSFTFDTAMLAAARARRRPEPMTTQWPLLDPVVPAVVTVAELTLSCMRPERTFLGTRLDAAMPRQVEELDVSIPIRFVGLDRYQIGRELLELHRRGADDGEIDAWRLAARRSGALPPRHLADAVLDDASREVTTILDGPPDLRPLLASATGALSIDLELIAAGSGGTAVRLRETIDRIDGHRLIRVEFTRPSNRTRVRAALELAALVVAAPDLPWDALLATRPASGQTNPAVEILCPVEGPLRRDAARVFLQTALSLHLRALREPLPMFERSTATLHNTLTIDDEELARDIQRPDAQFLWGPFAADDILAIPLRSDDELAALSASTVGRAQALAHLFWGSFEAFVPEAGLEPAEAGSGR